MVRPPLEPTSPSDSKSIKFLYSYGGKIVPRHPDGKLRYQGGHTRVLSVDRSVSFLELMIKMGELCGTSVNLRCQLPTEDLDALVSIKSDEDLANLIEEYDRIASTQSVKIRAFLTPVRSPSKSPSPPPSEYAASSPSPKSLSPSSSFGSISPRFVPTLAAPPLRRQWSGGSSGGTTLVPPQRHYGCHHCCRNLGHVYLIHNGNHWQ